MSKRSHCTIGDGKLEMCRALQATTEYFRKGKSKGIQYCQLTNIYTGKLTRALVIIKSGDHKEKGIVANFCPFCGERILAYEPETIAVRDAEVDDLHGGSSPNHEPEGDVVVPSENPELRQEEQG